MATHPTCVTVIASFTLQPHRQEVWLATWGEVARIAAHGATGRPLRTGETTRQTVRIAGRDVEIEWYVIDVKPHTEVACRAVCATGSCLYMKQRVTPAGKGTRVEVELDYQPPVRFVGRVLNQTYVERRIEREIACSLHNLTDLLEEDNGLARPADTELAQLSGERPLVAGSADR